MPKYYARLEEQRDRAQQERNQVLNRYYELDNEQKEVANIYSDAAIMGCDSRSAIAERDYMLQGMSRKGAQKQVFRDNLGLVLESGVGGFFADGVMGLSSSAVNYHTSLVQNSETGKNLKGLGEDVVGGIISEGMDSPEGSRSYKLSHKLQDKLNKGKTPSNAEVGALYRANVAQIESESRAGQAQARPVEVESEAGQPGIRPTWDTDAILRQAAVEQLADNVQQTLPAPLVQLAQEMAGTSIALERTAMERVQLVEAQAAETFGPQARAFGWNGQKALLEAWTGQRSTQQGTQRSKQDFYDGFALYYQAGLTGENMSQVYNRYAWALTEPQKQAAYRAGRQDAAAFAARGRGGAGFEAKPGENLDPRQEQASQTVPDDGPRRRLTRGQSLWYDSNTGTADRPAGKGGMPHGTDHSIQAAALSPPVHVCPGDERPGDLQAVPGKAAGH